MALLSEQDVAQALVGSEWTRAGDAIVREWRFPDFAAAVAFVDRVAEAAEAAGHHPDILLHGYNRVRLTLSTHSAGGDHGGQPRARPASRRDRRRVAPLPLPRRQMNDDDASRSSGAPPARPADRP